jgi:beta-xylosidase
LFFLVLGANCAAVLNRSSDAARKVAPSHSAPPSSTENLANAPTTGESGDQGNGNYANPVMPADFSDLDAVRVGRHFYAISSTMQYSPGMAILHSNDLVNWTVLGHVVSDVSVMDPELNWDRMNRPGRGIWAGAIRFHAGKFWVYYGTPDQGIFVSTASAPSGRWTPVKLALSGPGWDDPCPLWDDDGQQYLVATRFTPEGSAGTTYNIHLFKMNAAGDQALEDSDRIIHQSAGSEANKLYKIRGTYYHLFSEVAAEGRVLMMERSRTLNGPWEVRQLTHVNPAVDKEPNQGGLIQLASGAWYFLSHQGHGDWEGRAGVLLPVHWIGGWPIIGEVGADGMGTMVWRGKKPILGFPRTTQAANGDFRAPALKPEWEWNYQPRADKWSLTAHKGVLRLQAFGQLRPPDFQTTGNVLTQRAFRTKQNQVTLKLDISGMVDGQEAGLAHFGQTYCTAGVIQSDGRRLLSYNRNGTRMTAGGVSGREIYLRSSWGFDGQSHFSYSTDGHSYKPLGDSYQLTWGAYRGDRIGIYTFNTKTTAGYLDIESFQYSTAH